MNGVPVPVIEHKPFRWSHFREAFNERLLGEREVSAGATVGDYERESAEKDRKWGQRKWGQGGNLDKIICT